MSKINPTFSDFQSWNTPKITETVPGEKFFTFDVGNPLHNRGHFDSRVKKRMELIDNVPTFNKQIEKFFAEFKRKNGKPLRTGDPVKDLYNWQKWMNRAKTYVKNKQKSAIPWNYKQFGDIGIEDSTPRKNVRPSSSWLKHIQVNGNTLSLFLGPTKKNPSGWYDYGISSPKNLQKFLQAKSMGQIVSYLARKEGAAVDSSTGLKKLY